MARFCSLFSSSSGNSTYIGSGGGGILIDAGVSARQITLKLDCIGVSPADIGAIFITHEHSDHIKGLRVFASKNKIPVYATEGTINSLISAKAIDSSVDIRVINPGGTEVCGHFVKPFSTSHDVAESCGYTVDAEDGRKLAVATDTGIITEDMRSALADCDLVMIESNHDIGMVRNNMNYPYMLKRRILSDVGHLSNTACSEFVTELVNSGTTRVILGHLSKENNIPSLAYQTSRSALECSGAVESKDYILKVAGGPEPEMVVL
ncbi:MAG: MBL fold metallo-hydrolase [Clostridia bacterium]|nr:MBL fold metallo-hydrolase [Clostridia bacterium]